MRRPRSGIGAELVPLALILASLAGSLVLIVAVHRRASAPKSPMPSVAIAEVIPPEPPPKPAPPPVAPEAEESELPPAPAPEDPTPKAIARLTSAEAEQLLEASRADRKAAALEAAREAALLESEKWRRRESLVRLQLDSLDSKARKLETEVDELALERDALEKERDARKALAAKARSRPGQAILPHRGQNGTWRRPIVIECGNGMATLQPQGYAFGLLELASGFGPASNPFVAAVAREAIRLQGSHSPDGKQVVPYIFFLVRPDGIRAYYEARGRLEPLGITFGYELADQDWQVDFPDLDDLQTWDGSAPARLDGPDPLARANPARPLGASSAEDDNFPPLGASRRPATAPREDGPGGEFTWPPRTRPTPSGTGRTTLDLPKGPPGAPPRLRYSNSSDDRRSSPLDTSGGPTTQDSGLRTQDSGLKPRELALGGGPIAPLEPTPPGGASGVGGPPPAPGPGGSEPGPSPSDPTPSTKDDPANTFVWPPKPASGGKPSSRPQGRPGGEGAEAGDGSPPARHLGPFSRPLAMGLDSLASANPPGSPEQDSDPTRPDGSAGGDPDRARPQGGAPGGAQGPRGATGPQSTARGIGQGGSPGVQPPPGSIGVGSPGMPSDGPPPPGISPPPDGPKRSASMAPPDLPPTAIVDRRFEVVLVCGPRGVTVQPGGYRVTADALKDRDGLLKKQVVALVKARRTADPTIILEPRVRFLVQPGGDPTYWAARGQMLLSGLDWPTSTQVAEADHPTYLPSESW